MHDLMTTQQWLDWLIHLMADYPKGWKAHCWDRAQSIARDPQHADLPRMLTEAMHDKDTSISGEATQ